jgi:tRNA threonylcarbamoyl adenosine modification protein (Sua5/YciO/YrdC/YwlC family)
MRLHLHPERPAPRKLGPALKALRRDEVILYPTDTGYSFGCALSSGRAITALRRYKGMEADSKKPLALMVRDLAEIGRYGVMGNRAFRTVKRILPGPYTIVLRATAEVPRAMRNRDHEIGLRMPDHAVCHMLSEELGEPLVTGSLTPGDAELPELEDPEILERQWKGRVNVVLDAGPLFPNPSTILSGVDNRIEVLREGQGVLPG